MAPIFPKDGHCAVELRDCDGVAAVVESVNEVARKIDRVFHEAPLSDDWRSGWIELTVIADPDTEQDRRPFFCPAIQIVGMTYASPEDIDKWENELS